MNKKLMNYIKIVLHGVVVVLGVLVGGVVVVLGVLEGGVVVVHGVLMGGVMVVHGVLVGGVVVVHGVLVGGVVVVICVVVVLLFSSSTNLHHKNIIKNDNKIFKWNINPNLPQLCERFSFITRNQDV